QRSHRGSTFGGHFLAATRGAEPITSPLSVRMPVTIGEVEALFRYPVKSMRGEALDDAALGWHGIDGDRRFAFRRVDERGGFPWLSASRLADLLQFSPTGRDDAT